LSKEESHNESLWLSKLEGCHDWEVDNTLSLNKEEIGLIKACASKVVLSILSRESDHIFRRLLLHEAARFPDRLTAPEYDVLMFCRSQLFHMIHARESNPVRKRVLLYEYECYMENVFTGIQISGEARERLKVKQETRRGNRDAGIGNLKAMNEENQALLEILEGQLFSHGDTVDDLASAKA